MSDFDAIDEQIELAGIAAAEADDAEDNQDDEANELAAIAAAGGLAGLGFMSASQTWRGRYVDPLSNTSPFYWQERFRRRANREIRARRKLKAGAVRAINAAKAGG